MSDQPYPPDPRLQGYQQQPYQAPTEGQPYIAAENTTRSTSGDGSDVQSQYQNYVDPMGNQVESHEAVYANDNQRRANTRQWITNITYFVLSVLEIILLLRLLFRLLGASESSGFVMFLYNLSHIFVAPFNGIFNDQALGRSVFEISTLVAMIVYALLAWGIVSLGRLIFAPRLPGSQSITTTRRSRP